MTIKTRAKQFIRSGVLGITGGALSLSTVLAQTPELRADNRGGATEAWDVCNETSFILRAANALVRDGKMTLKGWDKINPGQCFTLNAPIGSPRYIFAESSNVHQGGIREWSGKTPICVSRDTFIADATQSCALQNLETRNYISVNPAENRTTLIEPDDFGDKADIAGIQRLLKDNGYKITRVDGLSGRRTNRYIREFKKINSLPVSVSNNDLIGTLAESAKKKQSDFGFELCNSSTATIWAAIATRENGTWQSRGWWTIMNDECVRPYTKKLKGSDVHFYALQENKLVTDEGTSIGPDKRLRSVATTPAQFCIAEAKFSALGREYCAESGYAVASFRPLPADNDGAKVTLSDQDFAVPSAVGLR